MFHKLMGNSKPFKAGRKRRPLFFFLAFVEKCSMILSSCGQGLFNYTLNVVSLPNQLKKWLKHDTR